MVGLLERLLLKRRQPTPRQALHGKENMMSSDQKSGNALGVRPYISHTGAFKDGSDSPRAFLERCLKVIEVQEDGVGAFVTLNLEGARAAADASTERWKSGSALSPIDGMPVGIKDIMETADMATEQGSPLFVGWQGKRDCAAVAALRQAGAVVLGKTVTTEFAASHPSTTRNPWDHSRTPGGSSSGSAAAVGSGMIPAALGSQVIGSIIRPSSFCGCVGFKPSVGGINRGGCDHRLVSGLMFRRMTAAYKEQVMQTGPQCQSDRLVNNASAAAPFR
jgi:Asp-tRNA(Asn)/Glu-tRNA(Gln) amidotransferase A subunit family amidase